MKRILLISAMLVFLSGCGYSPSEVDRAIAFRDRLLQSDGCKFTAVVTADYGTGIYTFSMDCAADKEGTVSFCVSDPETISGISGQLSSDGGKLQFEDTVLAFQLLADGELSPVSAPWIIFNALRSGYISAAGYDGDNLSVRIADSYESDALMLDIRIDNSGVPIYGEIFYHGRRILSTDIRNFVVL